MDAVSRYRSAWTNGTTASAVRERPIDARSRRRTRPWLPRLLAVPITCVSVCRPFDRLLGLGVIGKALPVDHHAGLVTDGPRIVTGSHDREVAGSVVHLFAVVHDDLHPSRDEVPHVRSLTAVGPGDRLDMFRPLPTRLERRPSNAPRLHVHEFELALAILERP